MDLKDGIFLFLLTLVNNVTSLLVDTGATSIWYDARALCTYKYNASLPWAQSEKEMTQLMYKASKTNKTALWIGVQKQKLNHIHWITGDSAGTLRMMLEQDQLCYNLQ